MSAAKPLEGRVCVITGATGGLGSAIARRFWDAGSHLLVVARSADASRHLGDSLPQSTTQKLKAVNVDLDDSAAIDAIRAAALEAFGHVDVLINAAAIQGPIGPLVDNDWQEWEKTLRINLAMPVALCRALLPLMGNGGRIINVSGGGATAPRANFTAYAAAKAALVRFTETLAEEVRDRGITVNALAPGAMKTRLLQAVIDAGSDVAGDREIAAAERADAGTPERAADLALFLASRDSDGITGKLISAVWDPYRDLPQHLGDLAGTDLYTLRRITPADRGLKWGVE